MSGHQGETNPAAILSDEKVVAIRALYLTGQRSMADLAVIFKVSRATIADVLRARYWRGLLSGT
jgi:hypothetical protein